jgi:rubrerythrin
MTFKEEAEEYMENSINNLQPEGCSIQPYPYDNIPAPKKLFGSGMQGWICPKCGRSLSPFIHECPHCNNEITIRENTNSNFG